MALSHVEIALPGNGTDCAQCFESLRARLGAMRGVRQVSPLNGGSHVAIAYDPDLIELDALERAANSVGAALAHGYRHDVLHLAGLDCADCAAKLEAAIHRVPGVLHAAVSFTGGTLRLAYDPELVTLDEIGRTVHSAGYRVVEAPESLVVRSELTIAGLDCADCAASIESAVARMPGVRESRISLTRGTLSVAHDRSLGVDRIIETVRQSGHDARLAGRAPARAATTRPTLSLRLITTALAAVLTVAGAASEIAGFADVLPITLLALAIVIGGYPIARSAYFSIVRGRSLDMNVLMTLAVIGAACIGEWIEAATTVVLFALGNALEGFTVDRARGAIRALVSEAPREARIRRNGVESTVSAESIQVGDVIVVRPGAKIAADGIVVAGTSSVSQAAITGESLPVSKSVDDHVFAGSINGAGYLEVSATRPYAENTINRIIHMVEEAQSQRAPVQRFVDEFSRVYTPAVIGVAMLTALIPWLVLGQPFEQWFYRALVLLVVACPCALVISTPVSIVSALSRAAKLGILIKGGAHLETAGLVRAVAFDKTGTLTVGEPVVTDVFTLGPLSETDLVRIAAAVETRSEHPLAAAVVREAERRGVHDPAAAIESFSAVPGKGVTARLADRDYWVGSASFLSGLGLDRAEATRLGEQLQGQGKTVLLVGSDDRVEGLLAVADRARGEARDALRRLREVGIQHATVLTGDNVATARAVASEVGADDVRAELMPEDKVGAVRELQEKHGKVAMVGDGVNDAPALAASSLGIAMGASGSDAALEAADVALMTSDLDLLPKLFGLARHARGIVTQNVVFALVIKAVFLILTFFGFTSLWLAIFADMGASLLVTLNGMRLLHYGRGRKEV